MELREGGNAVLIGIEGPNYGIFGIIVPLCALDFLHLPSRKSNTLSCLVNAY